MSKVQFFISLFLASVLGGLVSLGIQQMFRTEAPYSSIEERQRHLLDNQASNISIEVPDGLNFVQSANKVRPAVVHIKTSHVGRTTASNRDHMDIEDMLRQFRSDNNYHRSLPKQSSGSGVIISDDGFIVTNHHVIDEANYIEVVLQDKRSYRAKVIGSDPSTDLALLKIEASHLPFVRYGRDEDVNIGEWVLAIGNPFDLTSTVTAGIVSARGRNINLLKDNEYAIESFIQTDAAVNPGNSGGALVNLQGELIGVNTAIATHTGYYAGYSFAIPINLVKKVMDDLMNYGEVQRALLGVKIQEVDADLALQKELRNIAGVYIVDVSARGAAKRAGLRSGDVIEAIDETYVNSSSELQTAIATHRPGDKVKITYLRNGSQAIVYATLRNRLGDFGVIRAAHTDATQILGARLEKVSEEEKKKLGINHGVKVLRSGQGRIRRAGMKDGFIIIRVDNQPVYAPSDVSLALQRSDSVITLEGIYPDGRKDYYTIDW